MSNQLMTKGVSVLKQDFIHGFGSLIIREFFLKIFSFVGQIFLARILAPSDFGVYVMIVFIVNLLSLFADIGLTQALIQKKTSPTDTELSTIFFLKVLLSLLIISIIWLLSPFVSYIYPSFESSNITMLRIFSFVTLIVAFKTIPIALLERKIEYNLISKIDIMGVLTYYLIAIVLGYFHFGVWSIIYATLLKEVVEVMIFSIFSPYVPVFVFRFQSVKKMIKFGLYLQGNSLLVFLLSATNPVINGRFYGNTAVGLVDFSDKLASIPEIISVNFGRIAFSGFSRIQNEKELLEKSINKSVNYLSIILYIFPVIFIVFGGDIVKIIYTEKWIGAIPSLYWFGATVFFYPHIASLGQVILAIGKSKDVFYSTLVITLLGWTAAYFLVHFFGFTGIAIANFFIYFLLFVFYTFILLRAGFNINSIFSGIFLKISAALFALCIGLLIRTILPQGEMFLIIKLAMSTVSYFVLLLVFSKSDVVELVSMLWALKRKK